MQENIVVTSLCGDGIHNWTINTGVPGIVVCTKCLLGIQGAEIQEYRRQFAKGGVLMTIQRSWADA